MGVRVGLWRKLRAKELMLLNCGVGEDSWESLGLQGDPTSPFWRRSVLNIWCWSWNSNTLATWCKELTHWKRSWCWERSKAGEEGDNRGWDGWMASPTWWTWVWASSRSWWWTGKPGVPKSMGLQGVGHNWMTELNWTEPYTTYHLLFMGDGNFKSIMNLKNLLHVLKLFLCFLWLLSPTIHIFCETMIMHLTEMLNACIF